MGATATALLVGIATPGDLPVDWALDLMRGWPPSARGPGRPSPAAT